MVEHGARDALLAEPRSRFRALWTARDGAREEVVHVER
jgi:hypothetical protein